MHEKSVVWVGISQKPGCSDLADSTNTGRLVAQIAARTRQAKHHKTNLVDYAPLNEKNKLRYPTQSEIDANFASLVANVAAKDAKVVVLLGGIVTEAFAHGLGVKLQKWHGFEFHPVKHGDFWLLPVQHPSYIAVYRKAHEREYVDAVARQIQACLAR